MPRSVIFSTFLPLHIPDPASARPPPRGADAGYHARRSAPARQSRNVTNLSSPPVTLRYIYFAGTLLRHLRFLMSTDSANAAAMDRYTQQHLAKLDPAFAAMYNDRQFPEEAAS